LFSGGFSIRNKTKLYPQAGSSMKLILFITGLMIFGGCTQTVTQFSTKTKLPSKTKFLVLKPQIHLETGKIIVEKALLGTLVSELGSLGFSHVVAWHKMPNVYGDFFPRLYKSSKRVFFSKSNDITNVIKDESWKESFNVNLNLLGSRFGDAMAELKLAKWNPKYVFITGIEKDGATFSGNLELTIYGAVIDTVSRSVIWGMSFKVKSANNSRQLVIKAIISGRELIKELKLWVNKSR
jgi:hypothetical protein